MGGRGASSGGGGIASQLKAMKKQGEFPSVLPGGNYREAQRQALEGIANNWEIPAELSNADFEVQKINGDEYFTMRTAGSKIFANGGRIRMPENASEKEIQGLRVFLAQRYKRKRG